MSNCLWDWDFRLDLFQDVSDECHCKRKEPVMIEKDYTLFGTKILNLKTKEIGLVICTWKNKFTDKDVDFATCVDRNGKRYNIELDLVTPLEDVE